MNEGYEHINTEEAKPPIESAEEIGQEEIIPEEEGIKKLVSELRRQLKESNLEKQNNLDGWQRARADIANLNRRSEEEKKEFIKFANKRLIEEIIPVLESFEMAFSNKKVWESLPIEWRKGVEYIRNQLLNALKNNGLEELNPAKGEKFDPKLHEADSFELIIDKEKDGVIIRAVKNGYSLNGKIIIPPRVVVGEYKEEKDETTNRD